jgi:hypothetical protein
MQDLNVKIIMFFVFFMFFNSCIFIHDEGYKGLTSTTLAGHIIINNSNCFVSAENPEPNQNQDEWAVSAVINLETAGDRFVILCLTESNYGDILNDLPDQFINLHLTFYASDQVAPPGDRSIGNASEILLFGIDPYGQYQIAEFPLNPSSGLACSTLVNGKVTPGWYLGELDLTLLHKKNFIVARVADCGNFALGTATNPLVSEKNIPK